MFSYLYQGSSLYFPRTAWLGLLGHIYDLHAFYSLFLLRYSNGMAEVVGGVVIPMPALVSTLCGPWIHWLFYLVLYDVRL